MHYVQINGGNFKLTVQVVCQIHGPTRSILLRSMHYVIGRPATN